MRQLATIEPSQEYQIEGVCEELVWYCEKVIGVGFLGEVPARDTARHIIDSVRTPR